MTISYFRTAQTLITGRDSISKIGEEAKKLESKKAMIITDKVIQQTGLLSRVISSLEEIDLAVDTMDEVMPEPPFENLEQMMIQLEEKEYDLLIGVGGGSVLDATKVLSIMLTNQENVRDLVGIEKVQNAGIPTILVPTTAGTGSEVTYNAIFTDVRDKVKKGIVSPYLLPKVAIVDPSLTLTVPPSVTAATGMDALVHAVESYTAIRAGELTDGIALQAIKLISRSLRKAVYNGKDVQAREDMAMGSLLAGISLGNAGVGAVHALAYPLGGKFKVPHGVANSLLLPFVMKYNVVTDLEKFAEVAKALGENIEGLSLREAANCTVYALTQLAQDIEIPSSLKDVGVTAEDIPNLAEEASKIDRLLNNNPRWLTVKEIEKIYEEAYRADTR
ncbi:iron-containing alcohol dehydrogenase [Priestia filamentosa]|uniref:Alcohol dehydrogenase n=1 Tax=Priestia filamentosa TaxID=1402861 RepID=A0A1X7EGR2_9BACI|nr:iron-containing alcohol dehydrogenase [Priestia filamentosa]AKO92893.1 alcohol dehydrogenase [Priestia filamentosa]MDT3763018.1 iron-containing alcohol dehydrogenase [Priestia filamentosa]OXS69536.1 alcohol dehydrogenase [Priestia filamentosa]WRU97456.1 iron-containing alcohol dehydrogenase [Priestia filamentosa]SMF33696.1 Alcohol dehydrogenase, class IV [Priestia filamentosa]